MGAEQAAGGELLSLLEQAVERGVFPGAVAALGKLTFGHVTRAEACAGLLEPGGAKVHFDTPYDLASLTKPVVSIVALRLCQAGLVDLHEPVVRWLPELDGTLGGEASLALLLSHRAGLSPWGGLFREIPGPFGSPASKGFMLREAASRPRPAPEGSGSVYSDLGYLIAGEALVRASGLTLDELVRREVSRPLGIERQLFYAAALSADDQASLRERVAPTELCSFRGRLVRGEVHDENCAAFGGIAGHAGLFGTTHGVLSFGLALLEALEGRSGWVDQALLRWALAPRGGGGHTVGWDTKSAEGSSAGALFSDRSFGHLGFTGTSIWCDPVRNLCAVLLSNRVHPTRENILIRELRPQFHDAVAELSL